MEPHHSDIFRVELVTKNVVRGSSGTHFIHMRDNSLSFPRRVINSSVNNFYTYLKRICNHL